MRGLNAILLFFILVCCVRGEVFFNIVKLFNVHIQSHCVVECSKFFIFCRCWLFAAFVDIIKTDLNIINVVKSFQFTRMQISLNLLN